MSISNTMRGALIAAGFGVATATMLAAVVLPGWAQNAPQASADALSIDNFTFTPQTLTVKAGTTVTWTNKDDIPHGIASDNNAFKRSPALDTDDNNRRQPNSTRNEFNQPFAGCLRRFRPGSPFLYA